MDARLMQELKETYCHLEQAKFYTTDWHLLTADVDPVLDFLKVP